MGAGAQYRQFNCYEILGISSQSSISEIKKARIEMTLRFHPDRGGSHEQQVKINLAYEVLSDPVQRQAHDLYWYISRTSNENKKEKSGPNSSRTHTKDSKNQEYTEPSSEALKGIKARVLKEANAKRSAIWSGYNDLVGKYRYEIQEEHLKARERYVYYIVGSVISTWIAINYPIAWLAAIACAFPLKDIFQGIRVSGVLHPYSENKASSSILKQAEMQAKAYCEGKERDVDSLMHSLASLAELLLKPINYDDSEEQVARRLTAAFYIMGYMPIAYHQQSRFIVVSDGDEKILIRYRHRIGQAVNITYARDTYGYMKMTGASKAFLFSSPGLSGNALEYSSAHGIKGYSMEEMNEWINGAIVSEYSGPNGDIFETLGDLKSFIARISPVISGGYSRRRRSGYRYG